MAREEEKRKEEGAKRRQEAECKRLEASGVKPSEIKKTVLRAANAFAFSNAANIESTRSESQSKLHAATDKLKAGMMKGVIGKM